MTAGIQLTTLRSQKMRPSEACERSVRTTLMPTIFLAMVWLFL